MAFYLGTTLAISTLWGLVGWWVGGSSLAGLTVATITYAATLTIGCFLGTLRHREDITEGGVTNIYQNLPEVTTIRMNIRFSRDADHKFPLYYETKGK
jgi:hypothetical protein